MKTKIGDEFHRLTIIEFFREKPTGSKKIIKFAICSCRCGITKTVRVSDLQSGKTKSCGCLKNELTSKRFTTHGHSIKNKRLYNIWRGMISRCNNKKNVNYKHYGARNIQVCDNWQTSIDTFLNGQTILDIKII